MFYEQEIYLVTRDIFFRTVTELDLSLEEPRMLERSFEN
jgi:hypothetical protein